MTEITWVQKSGRTQEDRAEVRFSTEYRIYFNKAAVAITGINEKSYKYIQVGLNKKERKVYFKFEKSKGREYYTLQNRDSHGRNVKIQKIMRQNSWVQKTTTLSSSDRYFPLQKSTDNTWYLSLPRP
ncbi:MAG: hypothetical protein OXC40_00555 [Proteobacteria bacterium]|nr:hypothetical protein [Pseudomonadota bacterium]